MEKHWGQDVSAHGGFSGISPDALLLNLLITGAAEEEEEEKVLASITARMGANTEETSWVQHGRPTGVGGGG